MPSTATVSDQYRGLHSEELAAPFWKVPSTLVPSKEYDHQSHPWHTQRAVNLPQRESIVIKIEGDVLPHWIISTVERLNHLSKLRSNWDSYGAPPISANATTLAIQVMNEIMSDRTPLPSIVPTTEEGVQLEWHIAGIDMEVEVRSDGLLSVLYEDGANEHEPVDDDEIRFTQGFGLPGLRALLQTIDERV